MGIDKTPAQQLRTYMERPVEGRIPYDPNRDQSVHTSRRGKVYPHSMDDEDPRIRATEAAMRLNGFDPIKCEYTW